MDFRRDLLGVLTRSIARGVCSAAYGCFGRRGAAPICVEAEASTVNGVTDQVFDLASLTKVIVTAPLIFELGHQGVDLEGPIGSYLRAKGVPTWIKNLRWIDLLSHRSGLRPWSAFWIVGPGTDVVLPLALPDDWSSRMSWIFEVIARSHTMPPQHANASVQYSDLGYILLGTLLESYRRVDLQSQWRTRWCAALSDSAGPRFGPVGRGALDMAKYPCTGYSGLRGRRLCGEVHDDNAWALAGVAGHAGLFSGGSELVAWLNRFADDAMGRSFLEANAKALKQPLDEMLIGYRRADACVGSFGGGRAMGHYGFTGTAMFVTADEQGGLEQYAILLTNRVEKGRRNFDGIRAMRGEFFSLAHECLKR